MDNIAPATSSFGVIPYYIGTIYMPKLIVI